MAAHKLSFIVLVASFPVVLPLLLSQDLVTARKQSRDIAPAPPLIGGLALGRCAECGSGKAGMTVVGSGTGWGVAITALGG